MVDFSGLLANLTWCPCCVVLPPQLGVLGDSGFGDSGLPFPWCQDECGDEDEREDDHDDQKGDQDTWPVSL